MGEGERTLKRRWPAQGAVMAVAIFLSLGGCRMVGSKAPPVPESRAEPQAFAPVPEGVYRGVLDIEGGELQSILHLTRDGPRRLRAVMELAADLRAEGGGEVDASNVRLELSYAGSCPGRMVLVGRWDSALDVLAGVVRASDCTGEAEGTFRFTSASRERGNHGHVGTL